MKKQDDAHNLERFLEFNGKRISVLLANGTWYVAIKPICEALGIHFKSQHQGILADEILGQLSSEQRIVAADGKQRFMTCLPEKYVYGWLFSIRSDAPGLKEYKLACYDILFNHFHGTLTGRMSALSRRMEIEEKIGQLEEKLTQAPEYLEIQELKKEKTGLGKTLRQLDSDLVKGQLSLDLN